MGEKLKQIADQCRVVEHLATAMAEIHRANAALFDHGGTSAENLAPLFGPATARLMEQLADTLNGMDAVDENEDAWTYPVFKRAQELYPGKPAPDPVQAQLVEALGEAERQIEYLHEKFQETSSGNAVINKIDAALRAAAKGE